MIAQGFAANGTTTVSSNDPLKDFAERCVLFAQAVLEEANK